MSPSWPQMVNSLLQLLGELFQWEQTIPKPSCGQQCNATPFYQRKWKGSEDQAPMLTARQCLPKAAQLLRRCPASFAMFPLCMVNTNSAFTNVSTTPGHGHPVNTIGSRPKFGICCSWAPAAGRLRLRRQCQGQQASTLACNCSGLTASRHLQAPTWLHQIFGDS